jgi:hypothetical protein
MAVIIDIDHETGDLSQYSSTVGGGADLTVSVGAALAGTSYGLNVAIDDTTGDYGRKDITKVSTLRVRFYFDINSLTMGNGNSFEIFRVSQNGGSFNSLMFCNLSYTTVGGYKVECLAKNDAGANVLNDNATISDAPHYVEILGVRAATDVSADGSYEWWLDGVSQGSAASVDNYNYFFDFNYRVLLGAISGIDAGTSGTLYLDELVANDDGGEIGPATASSMVNAVAATATADGQSPAISAGANIAGVAGTATAEAIAPTVSAGASVSATTGTCTALAIAPTLGLGAGISAAVATCTALAVVPTLSAGANIAGATGTAAAAMPIPAISNMTIAALVALTLLARSRAFTLNSRDTGLTLEERSIDLTLPDR